MRTQHEQHGEELLRATGMSRADGAVCDVDLVLKRGEVLGLAGLVGAGRTELCRLLFGADKASDGQVTVKGKTVRLRSPRAALQAGIVLVPEERHAQGVVIDFSVRENITLPSLDRYRRARFLPFSSRRRERKAASRRSRTWRSRRRARRRATAKLSGGNMQKVVLAKWLARGADVFILDEPTHGIDVQGKEEIYGLVERLVSRGAGVIFVSSEFPELVRVCDRALVMSEGRVVGELAGDELTEHHIVDACFAARERADAEAAA